MEANVLKSSTGLFFHPKWSFHTFSEVFQKCPVETVSSFYLVPLVENGSSKKTVHSDVCGLSCFLLMFPCLGQFLVHNFTLDVCKLQCSNNTHHSHTVRSCSINCFSPTLMFYCLVKAHFKFVSKKHMENLNFYITGP